MSGHGPDKTVLYICARLREGTTVPVKVSRWNSKRVTVDGPALSEEGGGSSRSARREQAAGSFSPTRQLMIGRAPRDRGSRRGWIRRSRAVSSRRR